MLFHILILILFGLFLLAGLILVPLGLPGTWIIALTALLYSIIRNFNVSPDWQVIAVTIGLAALGELIEFTTGILGAKRQKVPTGAVVASIVGGIIGALIGVPVFLIGSFLGLLLGAYLGAFLYSLVKSPSARLAFQHANAILVSRIIATFFKTAVAVSMILYLVVRII